ncbi:MAG: DUF6326 family protein [Dehalococcoidales bacterium]|nr:DUF6326 family protein [Dehalococcoidales bacterium]
MNNNKSTFGIEPKVKLSLLWIFVVLLMAYADIVSLMDPTSAIRERMVGTPMSAGFLLAGAVVMVISIAPVVLAWVLNYKVNRWVSAVIGAFMIQQIVTGGHGWYYVLFESVEVVCILLAIWFTWKWKPVVKTE